MKIPGRKKTLAAIRWLRSRGKDRALILGYHRVSERARDPFHLSITPERLRTELEIIRRVATPVSLRDVVGGVSNGRPVHRGIAITFDDGYEELLSVALPILEQYEIPATVFVVAGCLGQALWWDRLEEVLAVEQLPAKKLSLTLGDGSRFERAAAGDFETPAELLDGFYARIKPLEHQARHEAIDRLAAWLERPVEPPAHRVVTEAELRRLASSRLFEVGAHTMTHPALPLLDPEACRWEIERSKSELETVLGSSVATLSYPFGAVTRDVVGVVRSSGFTAACSSRRNVVHAGSDRFDLPRFWPSDQEPRLFERMLERWLGV